MSRTKAEVREELESLEVERRSYMEEVRHGTGAFNEEEAKTKLDSFEERRAALEKEYAECDRPEEKKSNSLNLTNRDFIELAEGQKRSITIGGNGKINQVTQLFENIGEKDDILNAVTFDYSENASTNIPILEPGLGEPEDVAEGGTVTEDSTAAMATNEIQVYGTALLLGVSAEALRLNTVNIQEKLPVLFQKALRKKLHRQLLQGDFASSEKGVQGIFTGAAKHAEGKIQLTGSAIKISELATLALKVAGMDETFEIVMNPATYTALLADSTAGEDVKIYKEGLIRDKMIEGVKVRLDAKAPSVTSAGAILAVAVPLSRFHVGVAGEMTITPIKVKGDTKTYFQAETFIGGRQITNKDYYYLAVAGA